MKNRRSLCLRNTYIKLTGELNIWGLQSLINPSTPKISLVILLTVCQMILIMLVWRIWYWINLVVPYFSLFSSLVCMILYRCSKEKFCLGHSLELKDWINYALSLNVGAVRELLYTILLWLQLSRKLTL